MNYSLKRAFSLSEVLVTMGLVGIMCMTTLSVNSMSNDKCKISETKFSQTESALKTWEKEILKQNETGIGAVSDIKNQSDLVNSLTQYLGNRGIETSKTGEYILNTQDAAFKDYTKIKLNNGVVIGAKYIATGSKMYINGSFVSVDIFKSRLAIIRIDIPSGIKNETISEAYYLTPFGLKSLNIYSPSCVQ